MLGVCVVATGQWNSEVAKFEYIKKLGEGGFGEVWLADDPRRGEKVAVKFLHLKLCDQSNIDVFKREFEILSELKQVHLARVFDFGFSPENEQYFLSTEFCPGKPLLEAIEGKSLRYFEEILVQILSALECIHSQGVIHFDIKPENVLVEDLDGHPNVKLVDFGVAVRLKALPQQFGGTLAFIAPEVLARSTKLDHRVDLYSLGMLCLFCLTGKLPFRANDSEEVMEWHKNGKIPPNLWKGRNVPGYLREITEKLLAKNPSDRFSNSRVVLNFLNLATGGRYRHEEEELHAQIPIEGPIVERREEVLKPILQRMDQILKQSGTGAFSASYFITGDAGLGKSRILEEVRHVLQVKEIRFLQIDCDWNVPSWPKLEKWLGLSRIEGDALDQKFETQRRMDALLDAAKQAPLCVLIDDFHKADQDLRTVVTELSSHSQKMRENGQAVPLFLLVATEEEMEGGQRLPHLSAKGISSYLKLVLGDRIPTENLAEVLYQYSGGLPLLMVEGLRFLAPHFFRGESLENLLRPDKIHLLYEEKIKKLKPSEEELLLILALLFRPASEEVLLKILRMEPADFGGVLENCLKSGLLSGNPFGDPTYRVASQALALDLIGSLDSEKRRMLHGKIVQGLVECQDIPKQELAYHWAKAGESAKAVLHYQEAGEEMEKGGKISSACECFKKAADLMGKGSEAWMRLNLKAFRLLVLSGNYKEAEAFPERLKDFPSWERDEAVGWFHFRMRRFPEARENYSEALNRIPEGAILQRILVENAIGNVDLHTGQAQAAVERFRKTLEWERELPAEDRAKISNNNLGLSLSLLGENEAAIKFFKERLASVSTEKVTERLSMLNGMGFSCLRASRFQETIAYLKQAVVLAESSGALNALFSAMGNLLTALLKENRYVEGLSILQKTVSYQRKFGNRRDIAHNLLRQTSVYLMLGMGEFADACIKEGLGISQEISEELLVGWFSLLHAYWERDFGTFENAEKSFLETESLAEKASNDELRAWARYGLAEIYFDHGNAEKCRKLLEQVKAQGKDHEFDTRLKLLQAKATTSADPGPLFAELEAECLKNNYRELLWEVYQAWGQSSMKRKKKEEAQALFEKGCKIIDAISSALPEEYQSRYRNQAARWKLYEDREEAQGTRKQGFFARLGFK